MLRRIHKNQQGFSLAEMLLVVAIIIILAGLVFIALPKYQRSMEQLEYDGIAKELFLTAQNHLSMAEGQEYFGMSTTVDSSTGRCDFGYPEDADKGIYYFVVGDGTGNTNSGLLNGNNVLALMLPDLSIDDTVRMGGSYIIRYQKTPAQVLDVFYSDKNDTRFGFDFTSTAYSNIYPGLAGDAKKENRKSYGTGKKVLGYYGGVDALTLLAIEELDVPVLNVFNSIDKDILRAKITIPTYTEATGIRLIVTGVTSRHSRVVPLVSDTVTPLESTYETVLDDITADSSHFKKLFCSGNDSYPGCDIAAGQYDLTGSAYDLIPGEDIIIRAQVYRGALVSFSNEMRTNSLFASYDESNKTVEISSMRHLANLGNNISSFTLVRSRAASNVDVNKAVQTSDLSWDEFSAAVGKTAATAIIYDSENNPASAGIFIPIYPEGILDYDGQGHSIKGLNISASGDAGLFSDVEGGRFENLKLEDFTVSGTTSAGALAGTSSSSVFSNILVTGKNSTVSASTGPAGGLAGSVTGGTVSKCASAVRVSGGSAAGGLVGTTSTTAVSGSYSGGHTTNGAYSSVDYDVAGTVAGGLIGSYEGGNISYSYSTCSVSGNTAGGLAGVLTCNSVTNCYATGLVNGTDVKGAFAGSLDGNASGCSYYSIINEIPQEGKAYTYLPAFQIGNKTTGVKAFDTTAASYSSFIGSSWDTASAYDDTLGMYYQGKYNLKTVAQLLPGSHKPFTVNSTDFVTVHYGDWPSPEAMTVNTKN